MNSSAALKPVLFLDFDDVLCLNTTYGGYDVIQALSQVQKKTAKVQDFKEMWEQLFVPDAKVRLKALHNEFAPRYVLSTSWRNVMNKGALLAVLRSCDLDFVAQNLHEDWQTPSFFSPRSYGGQDLQRSRSREIFLWFEKHPEQRDNWVVLDDECSGTGLAEWPVKEDMTCIVLCREDVGLSDLEYERLRAAFLLRVEQIFKGPDHDHGR